MFEPLTYQVRRAALVDKIDSGVVLILGNAEIGMNYAANVYHFRQDSNFLYFAGIDRPNLALTIDLESGEVILYGNEYTMDDIVWTGPVPALTELAARSGISQVRPLSRLSPDLKGKKLHFTPPYRDHNRIYLSELLDISPGNVKDSASTELIGAIVALRSYKTDEELVELEKAVRLTNAMHLAAMRTARPGIKESEVHAAVLQTALAADRVASFPVILSHDGQILHNHHHHNTLKAGRMVLCDCGGTSGMHYAGDMTRTFPVARTFTQQQKEVYNIALASQEAAIEALKPGISYQEVHKISSREIAKGLIDLGLMKGDPEAAVDAGAHALFFPHGLGHMMGLDVHDMEDLGEDHVGYNEHIRRSEQFGLAYLRLGRKLEERFVITVEPGIYFIPELMDMWRAEGKYEEFIDYQELQKYRDFGGIRIEDDYVITADGARLLGNPVPKSVADLEAFRAG